MCEQNASYLAKPSELGSKTLNKIRLKIIPKAIKLPLQLENFPGKHAPGPPSLELLLFLNQIHISSAEKNVEIVVFNLLKICYATCSKDMLANSSLVSVFYCFDVIFRKVSFKIVENSTVTS